MTNLRENNLLINLVIPGEIFYYILNVLLFNANSKKY